MKFPLLLSPVKDLCGRDWGSSPLLGRLERLAVDC